MQSKTKKTARKPRSVRENTIPPAQRLTLTVGAACDTLGVGRSTIYGMIASGELKSVMIGGRRLIPRASIEALVQRAQ